MKIKSVEIINYKSIKNVVIPFNEYGTYSNKSQSTFFVGLNETGKTAILEALSYIKSDFSKIDYEEICFKPSLDKNEYIELYVIFETIKTNSFWVKELIKICGIPKELSEIIEFSSISKNIYNKEDEAESKYSIGINNLDYYKYLIEDEVIYDIKTKNSIRDKITKQNANSFIKEDQKILKKTSLEEIISIKLAKTLDIFIPKVQVWKPKDEYLINSSIDLSIFKDDTSTSIPLTNIFNLSGYSSDKEIKQVIERALKKQEKLDELKEKMSDAVTKHINKIWIEHKIKIIISINASICKVFIEDKDKKHNYYKMEQRSEGFRQFISLILSLSALNNSKKLENNVILIDEPEVHLHPSGVRYMRNEILKIGKKNNVFVSTHSHYMVDTNCPERHWIVKKTEGETFANQIDENTPLEDDDVLISAFGLNLFKELLPKNILVVEGGDDKEIISHSLKLFEVTNNSIKSAGGASKSPGIASILINENVPAYILFDDDKEGKDNKKRILDKFKESYSNSNVFTLRDLVKELPANSTIEDLMPIDFVKNFFEKHLDDIITIDPNKAIIIQLKQQNEKLKDKQKMESLKIKLSKEFALKFNTKTKLKNNVPLMIKLIESLIVKWEN